MFIETSIGLQSIGFIFSGIAASRLLNMSVMLVAADFDWFLDVHLDDDLLDALLVQIERGRARPVVGRAFHRRLEASVPDAIGAALDADLRPPSESQRAFAQRISAKLRIAVPTAAWRYRSEMGAFLERCVELLSNEADPEISRKSSKRTSQV